MLGRLPSFDYYRPATIEETLTAMERLEGNFCILAGGTDLLVGMKERRGRHASLLDIKAVAELGAIRADNGTLSLGATATTRAIAASPLVRERAPLLCQSLKLLGSMQIGNRATIGGNLSNGSPASDSAPPLLALGASVKLVGKEKERWVPLDNFFIGPKKTVIESELLVEVKVPASPAGRGIFYKLGPRNAPEDICIVSAAVYGVPDGEAGAWKELRTAPATPRSGSRANPWMPSSWQRPRGSRRRKTPSPFPTSAARPTTGARWSRCWSSAPSNRSLAIIPARRNCNQKERKLSPPRHRVRRVSFLLFFPSASSAPPR